MTYNQTKLDAKLINYRTVILATLFLLTIAPSASADYITGVTATTNMGSGFGTDLNNTVNGVGLSSLSLTATHAATIPANSWVSSFGGPGQITFNLGGQYSVEGFSFWNQNGGGPGFAGSTGIQNVQVLFSSDGINFTPLPGGPSVFAQVPGTVNLPPQIFSFSAVNATHFRFNVLSNYGYNLGTGFAEVAFDGVSTVPEPTTLLLLAAGLTGAAAARRRQKARKTSSEL